MFEGVCAGKPPPASNNPPPCVYNASKTTSFGALSCAVERKATIGRTIARAIARRMTHDEPQQHTAIATHFLLLQNGAGGGSAPSCRIVPCPTGPSLGFKVTLGSTGCGDDADDAVGNTEGSAAVSRSSYSAAGASVGGWAATATMMVSIAAWKVGGVRSSRKGDVFLVLRCVIVSRRNEGPAFCVKGDRLLRPTAASGPREAELMPVT